MRENNFWLTIWSQVMRLTQLKRRQGPKSHMENIYKPKDVNWEEYYRVAEPDADAQWKQFRELFKDQFDHFHMSVVLDFACGHGRMAEKFSELAGKLICCDINRDAIEFCKQRFLNRKTKCEFEFIVNDEGHIPITETSVSFVYSWDAMVHFEHDDLAIYIGEFYRVLREGAYGFIHHSNLGGLNGYKKNRWFENPHWRANVSASSVKRILEEKRFVTVEQHLLDWGIKDLDCITIFRKR